MRTEMSRVCHRNVTQRPYWSEREESAMRNTCFTLVTLFGLTLGCGSSGGGGDAPQPVAPPSEAELAPAAAPEQPGKSIDLQGAGATFPYPLYSKWVAEYQKID